MPLLRLTQTASGDDRYRVEIAYESDKPRQTSQADVDSLGASPRARRRLPHCGRHGPRGGALSRVDPLSGDAGRRLRRVRDAVQRRPALAQAGRPHDAREYARAALRGFESFGERAAGDIQNTRQLIEMIEKEL